MGLSSSIDKLDSYYRRLDKGKARKIKASHVEKVIDKIRNRLKELEKEKDDASKESRKERLKRKIRIAREQLERAEWLLKKVRSD